MAKKLYYFNLNGLAESIRYILHYSGQTFEDIRYDRDVWPVQNIKDSLPFGQLPIYEEGDRKLNQSIAIARYVGSQNKLVPSDPWKQAVLDAAVLNIYDFWKVVLIGAIREKDPTIREENKKKIIKEEVVFFMSRFERDLKANKGFFGGQLTWADFVFVGIVETMNLFLGVDITTNYPTTSALLGKITSLPGVKEYIANRKPYVLPAHLR